MNEKYEFLTEKGNFLEKHTKLLDIIKKEYKIERFENLQEKELEKIKWTNRAKERNFYTVLKILAENEPLTIAQIIKLDSFHKEKNRDSSIQTYLKRFNGRKEDNAVGLIEKNIVERIGEVHKYKYRLTIFGVFLAIEFFYNSKAITMEIITDDESRDEIERSNKFLDNIAKNYSDYLPLIFGKWNVLKTIHPNKIYLIKSILHPESKIRNWMRTLADIHLFTRLFNSNEKQITAMFYYDFIYFHGTELNHEQKLKLGDEVMHVIENVLEIVKHKTLMEKIDIAINEAHIRGIDVNKLDKMYGKMRKLEKKALLLKM